MRKRDQEVRVHEQAHKSVGGAYAGNIHLTLERGPDGKSYAVGGSVSIDAAPVRNDPKATITKMRQVQAAALAPASPSGPDLSVAASAAQAMAQAKQTLAKMEYAAQSGEATTRTVGTALAVEA